MSNILKIIKVIIIILFLPFLGTFFGLGEIFKMFDDLGNMGTPKEKGTEGENRCEVFIKAYCNKRQFLYLKDMLIPNRVTGTSQIDFIIILNTAIAVIEVKNLRGELSGSDYGSWTQTIHGESNYINNPLKQNWGHIQALKELLGGKIDYFNLIAFTNNNKLEQIKISNRNSAIANLQNLETIINSLENNLSNPIQHNKEDIAEKITSHNITDLEIRKKIQDQYNKYY